MGQSSGRPSADEVDSQIANKLERFFGDETLSRDLEPAASDNEAYNITKQHKRNTTIIIMTIIIIIII